MSLPRKIFGALCQILLSLGVLLCRANGALHMITRQRQHCPWNNMGIKHGFLCINICWAPKEVLNTSQGVQQMLIYRRSMFDSCYCIKTFFHLKPLEKMHWKGIYRAPILARKGTLPANVLKTPLPGHRRHESLLLRMLLMMASVSVTVLECLYVKPQSRAFTARELPC